MDETAASVLLCAVMLFSVLGAEAGGVQYAHTYLAASEKTILLEHMPRTDADGNELLYELVPGVTDHYTAEGLPTAKGLDVTLRYLDDHDWSKVRTEPDCEKRGEVVYTCDGCGAINRYTLAPLGHDYAVCEKDGYHLYVCRRCGKWYAETIEATGHAWGAWIVDTPATSTTRGTKHRVCKRCLQKEIASIPVSSAGHEHHYDFCETIAPTCSERGYTKYTCPDDGASFIDTDSYVGALGHDWVESWRTASTARTHGVICYQCTRCGELRYESLPKQDGAWRNGFWDVGENDWFFDAVRCVAYNDYMNGTSNTRFEPNGSMTRAMLVTVLYRMVGSPSVRGLTMPFYDVPDGSDVWFHDVVLWAYDAGVVQGVSDTEFAPYSLITREQMVTIFHRYANYAGYDTSDITTLLGFADALSVSDYARDALSWAVRAGIVNGIEENGINYLQPQGTATRAQAAAIFQRFDAWRLG